MISMKTNAARSSKLPVPAPKHQESAPRFSEVPAKAADDLSIPAFLDRKKNTELGTVSALAAKVADPDKRAAIEKVEVEKASRRAAKDKPKKAGRSPARSRVPAKKAAATKPAAGKATVGQTACEAILGGKTNEQALAAVMKRHPDCKSNVGCMRWYRNKLRKDGKLKEPKARPTRAA